MTRRQFLARSSAAVLAAPGLDTALGSARAAAPLRDGRFAEGVMSGDPGARAITLWTRLHGVERRGGVRLEVARDSGFRRVVAHTTVTTGPGAGGAVKARVTGLAPYEQYYYRFETRTTQSPVGRFRTAPPPDSRQPLTFAFWACQDYTHGYYTAHAAMLREDLDFVVCLGDYIYAESAHTVAGGTGVRDDPIGAPGYGRVPLAARTLADYRAKYALYRSDPVLRALHRRFPLVATWDDHEVQNDYAGGVRDGGLPPRHDYSVARRDAAHRAWEESMPSLGRGRTGRRIHRRLRFGAVVDLIMLDVRRYRHDQPCDDAVATPCEELDRPRALLGAAQMAWAKAALSGSRAAWKIVGSGVMLMGTRLPSGEYLRFDSWQGYTREREELLRHIRARRVRDTVFLSGDVHAFVAGDVRLAGGQGPSAGPEFACGSITSANPGETQLRLGAGELVRGSDASPQTDPAVLETLRAANPWVARADVDHHGFGLVRASHGRLDVSFRRVATIKRARAELLPDDGFRWQLHRGQRSIAHRR